MFKRGLARQRGGGWEMVAWTLLFMRTTSRWGRKWILKWTFLFFIFSVYQKCISFVSYALWLSSIWFGLGKLLLAWTTCITWYVTGRWSSMFQIGLDSTSNLTLSPRICGGRMHLSMSKWSAVLKGRRDIICRLFSEQRDKVGAFLNLLGEVRRSCQWDRRPITTYFRSSCFW